MAWFGNLGHSCTAYVRLLCLYGCIYISLGQSEMCVYVRVCAYGSSSSVKISLGHELNPDYQIHAKPLTTGTIVNAIITIGVCRRHLQAWK